MGLLNHHVRKKRHDRVSKCNIGIHYPVDQIGEDA